MRLTRTLALAAIGLALGFGLSIRVPFIRSGFMFEAHARAHCPSDTIVWVNTWSRIYHFVDNEYYADTRLGAYMCETDAKIAGARAAFNERHP
jgi:hypothetical protein